MGRVDLLLIEDPGHTVFDVPCARACAELGELEASSLWRDELLEDATPLRERIGNEGPGRPVLDLHVEDVEDFDCARRISKDAPGRAQSQGSTDSRPWRRLRSSIDLSAERQLSG